MVAKKWPKPLGFIYLLSNPAMPGIVKVGHTSRPDVEDRVGELFTTSLPLPFSLEDTWFVEMPAAKEALIHSTLDSFRTARNREFFQLTVDEARPRITEALYGIQSDNDIEILRGFTDLLQMLAMAEKYPEQFDGSKPVTQESLNKLLEALDSLAGRGSASRSIEVLKQAFIEGTTRYNQVLVRKSS